ncbi:DUF488 domain-containing protein [Rhizobium cauense]|uniref:DUF488 domain-containing protein n=1 Tax=Rhizobium cauense TaxID=1166683 RepID=UPI0030B8DAF9
MPFFTIGHSTRSLDEFIEVLAPAAIDLIVDVRAFPRSRTHPAFNIETLPASLDIHGIGYEHWSDLGGRRRRQSGVPCNLNALWRNASFHNYADYALSDRFQMAISRLIAIGTSSRVAMMCSEAAWWRCHRRIIADYLLLRGFDVDHLMAPGRTISGAVTPGAVMTSENRVRYPAETAGGYGCGCSNCPNV